MQKPPEPIKAVTFDVGGTLIEPWPSVGHVYAEVAARNGLKNVSAEVLETRFRDAWRTCGNFTNSREGWGKLVDETFRGLTAEPPSTTFFPELYERFAERDAWHVFDDVLPALDILASRGIRLGIISNWDERLRLVLNRLRLDGYFETLTISCEVAFAKPSPIIFEQAAGKLGLPPASIMHVGDSLEHDVRGARSAGFQALRIHREDVGVEKTDIRRLTDIPAALYIH